MPKTAFCFVPAFRASAEAPELCEVGWTLGFSDQHLADVAPKGLPGLAFVVCSNEALAAYLHVAPLKLNGVSTGAVHFQRAVSEICPFAWMAPLKHCLCPEKMQLPTMTCRTNSQKLCPTQGLGHARGSLEKASQLTDTA